MNKLKLLKSIIYILLFSTSILYTSKSINSNRYIKTKEVNILMPAPFADSTKELVNEFNKLNSPLIKVNVTRGPMETEAVSDLAISNLLLGNTKYDALLMDVTWVPKYISAGWLSPLNKFIEAEEWNQLTKGAQKGNKFNGLIYRWPLVADMGLLYWRTDLMNNPPRTPDELVSISRELQLRNKVKYGYVWQGKQYEGLSCVFLELVHGFGGSWISKKGEVTINTARNIEAVSWLYKLIKDGVTPKEVTNFAENEALQTFAAGESAFMRNWPYAWAELQKDSSKVKGLVAVTTMISKKGLAHTATLGSWGFSIIDKSNKKKEAFKIIKYLTSVQSQKRLFEKYGYTPISKKIYADPYLTSKYPILNSLKKGLEISIPRPEMAVYAQISDVLQRNLSSILTGKDNIRTGLNKAQNNTMKILNSTGEY